MKQKNARALMIGEWNRWLQTHSIKPDEATGRDALKFFFELQDRRSPLMDFQAGQMGCRARLADPRTSFP